MKKVQGSTHCDNEANLFKAIDHLLGRFYTGERDPKPLETILKPFLMIVEELPPNSCKQKVKKYTVVLNFEREKNTTHPDSGTRTAFEFEYKKPRLSLLW